MALPDGSGDMPISPDLRDMIARCRPQVMVDFTNATGAMEGCRVAAAYGVNLVVGATGLAEANLEELDALANERGIGAFVAPNFALGAALLIHLARGLGKYFDYADVVEMHHETKIDSPSGTAMALARSLSEDRDAPFHRPTPEREPIAETRGGDMGGVSIHSVRMPGRMAHHEVILGTARPDPEPEARHHQPGVLHAGRSAGGQGSIKLEGLGGWPGQVAGPLALDVQTEALLKYLRRIQ